MSRLDGAMVLDDRLGLLVGRPRMWSAGKNWGGGLEWISMVPFIIKNPYYPI